MDRSHELFNRWFVSPLEQLKSIPNGDGGFIVLSTCCFLYERYAKAIIKQSNKKADRSSMIGQFSADFGTTNETAEEFWSVIRDGILHQGFPKQTEHGEKRLPGYILHTSFPSPVDLGDWGGEAVLRIQPWLFMYKVIELWQDNMELLDANESFPLPSIM